MIEFVPSAVENTTNEKLGYTRGAPKGKARMGAKINEYRPRSARPGEIPALCLPDCMAAIFDDVVKEVVELEAEFGGSLGAVFARALQIRVIEGKELLSQLEHLFFVFSLDPEQRRENPERMALGDHFDEVAFPFVSQLVDLLLRTLRHDLVEALDVSGRKETARNFAHVPMFGRIHLDDGAHVVERRPLARPCLQLFSGHDHGPHKIAEDVGLA